MKFVPLLVHSGTTSTIFFLVPEGATKLAGAIQCNVELFDRTTIERMRRQFRDLFSGIVANPEARLSELALLSEAERHAVVVEWTATESEYPEEESLAELFEETARRSAEAVAVVYDESFVSYGELERRSNRVARYLRRCGVGEEALVGLCVERSVSMVVGMLGILKAGGAYVPLDPDYPTERLEFMFADSEARVVVTQKSLRERLPASDGVRVVSLDEDWATIEEESSEPLGSVTRGDNLAYVIYTSGSTGQAKGVSVTQRAVSRLVFNTNYIRLGSEERVAQASTASFDAATFEIWGALLHGGCLVGVTKEELLSPEELSRRIGEQRVSAMFVTTALFNQLASEKGLRWTSVRQVLFGGEAVNPSWVRRVLEQGAPERLLHVYGPTESTTFASWHLVESVEETATTIPIGRALSNTQVYLLDRNLKPVPMGVVGELYIGGPGLAREYLKRPELTAEKFVPDAFSVAGGHRLYRTGDLCRWLPEGELEFLGRFDQQVKLRGFRIELGEIEAVLRKHPSVREAVVLAREDLPGGKRLVAYLVAAPGKQEGDGGISDLRRFLKGKLPDYMVPSAFVFLDRLPLTATGKVDRKALAAPVGSGVERGERLCSTAQPRGAGTRTALVRGLRRQPVGNPQQFLRAGRSFSFGDAAHLPGAGGVPGRAAAGGALRVADRGWA